LIGYVGDAYIEEGETCFDGVSLDDLQLAFLVCALDAFEDLAHHAIVVFDGHDVFGLLKKGDCHVSHTWTNIEYDIGGFEGGFGHYCSDYGRVFEEVLAE
jgi:hypothetical protein